jgi:bacteriocin-like protein
MTIQTLSDDQLNAVSGGEPNIGRYYYDGEHLMVAQQDGPSWKDIYQAWADQGKKLHDQMHPPK